MQKQKKILLISVLTVIFILSLIRIVFFIEQVSRESLQMDFTAYHTAGKVMNLGLSPYNNYIAQDWFLWDGVAQFKHSRFLYPPIAGSFFQPIAKLDYSTAKHIWTYLNFLFVIAAVFLWLKISRFDKNVFAILLTGVFVFNFFPFYTLLERGQIDGLTFFLLSSGIFLVRLGYHKFAGFTFAIASVFKFYSLMLIPFLLIKKKYSVVLSLIISFAAIICIMYIYNGKESVNDYVFNQVPRISQYGESGTDDMRPDSWILKNYFRISRYSYSMVEGRMYISESISFFSNASVVRLMATVQTSIGLNISASIWSLILAIPVFFYIYSRIGKYSQTNLWVIIILVILLCSPFTWVMNLVWLIPVFFILLKLIRAKNYKNFAFILITLGLFIIFLPDNHRTYIHTLDNIIKLRHIAGELLILTGMLILPKFIPSETKISVSES